MPGSLSVVAVPEPGTWALMLAGMHLGGFQFRRRRRHSRAVGASDLSRDNPTRTHRALLTGALLQ
jgi:hypothetical protein